MKAVLVCEFILMQVILCLPCVGGELKLVDNRKSEYGIYISPESLPAVKVAAEDLQLYIAKATGAKLPIINSNDSGGRPAIIVGNGPDAEKAGIDIKNIPAEGFTVKTVGNKLFIVGKDTPGNPYSNHWSYRHP